MEQFTADIQELNSRHSIIGEKLAGDLSSRFPRLQHAFSAAARDQLVASGAEASAGAEVIALLPLDSSSATRQALENAFQSITATGSETIVVDMDIANPHNTLLAHSGGEGISDHFLYGVSPEQLLAPSPAGGSLKVISPGTFTPRAVEIYSADGWNELIGNLKASAPGATLLLLGPPADKFPSLAALSKTGTVIALSARPDSEAQQTLPSTLEQLQANLPADAQFKLIWLDTEPPAETDREPEAEKLQAEPSAPVQPPEEAETTPAAEQAADTEIEDLPPEDAEPPAGAAEKPLDAAEPSLAEEAEEISAEIEDLPEESMLPAATIEQPEETAAGDQQADTAETPVSEEGKISAEIDGFLEETNGPPAQEPAPAHQEIPQLKADGVSLESEKLPGQRSLETSVDDGVKDDTFGDIELPALSETPLDAATDTPKTGDDDEEIFLPDELLFLDEDEQEPLETATEDSPAAEKVPVPAEPAATTDLEAIAEPEAETDESAPQIPDLSAIDVEDILPTQEEPAEAGQLPVDQLPPEQDEVAQAEQEPAPQSEAVAEIEPEGEDTAAGIEEVPAPGIETAAEADDEFDSDALFSDDDLDDEDEAEEQTTPASGDEDLNDEALAMIEKFRETSDQPQDAEPDLALDDDPLGEGTDEQEPEAEADAEPVPELEAEPEAETEAEPVIELEAEPESETEALEELEVEPEAETEAEDTAGETDSEQAPGEEAGEATPVEADLIDITEGDAPLEAETAAEEDAVAEPEAEPEPVVMEEVSELDADELEEIETGDLESLDEEINTTAADQAKEAPEAADAAPEELEEIAEDTEAGEPAEAEAAEEDELDVPADEELDELLSGTDDLDDIDGGITLDDLDEIDDVPPAAAGKGGKARKKKAASKSRSKPAVMLLLIIVMGFGLFFVWKQGYVSKLVRQIPALSSVAGFIPSTDEERQQEQEALRQAAADSVALADSLSRIPPPPQYDKLGYSIQIGSFRYLPQALAVRDRLVQNGLQDVFVVPLVLDSLGNWNRLYLGMYRSAGRGDTALLNLATDLRRSGISDGVSGGAITRHTPLTLMVAEASDPDSLQAVMEKLASNLIPSYMIQLARQDSLRPPLYRLYSGAFENESQAAFLRESIFNIGVRATVVEREGPAEQTAEQQAAPAAAPPV